VPSPDLLERAGVLYERLGDRARARDIYSQILALSPTHTEARAHLERLDGELPSPLTLTLDALGPLPITDPKAPFEVLGEELFVRVEADGRATEWHRRILRAQAVPESRDARTLRIRFDPTQTSVKVLSAHIHRAHRGNRPSRSEPITTRTLTSIAEDWYGLYYDLRELAIPFDRLAPGDLIEVSWRRDPLGQLFPGVFDLYELLADRVPKHRYFATVEAPASLPLRARLNENGAGRFEVGDRTLSPDGLTQHFTLRASNLPALAPEVQAPGASEVSPVWQVSSFASWRDVATWYRDLIEPSRVLTPDMRARVTELSRNASPDERRRRLIALVTRDIRYVGLEFGIHGLKPYRTDEVWARGFGDCKDKATLLATLFQAAELPAEVALVRTRRQGRLADPLPSLALFDHAIAYLPDRDQFIDPTALHFGLGELPAADQGAQVLVLNPETHGDLARVPVDPPARNGLRGDYSITVDRQGRGGLQGAVAFYGTQAAAYRELLLDPGTRSRRLGEALSSRYPGLVLGDYRVSDPADPTRPVELAFSAEVPRLAAAFPGELQLPRPAGLDGQIARLAPTETRASPLVLGPPHRIAVQFRYLLPEDYRVIDLPSDASATSSEGHFEVTWRSDDAVVTVTAELTLEIDQVSVAAYPAFRDFVRKLELAVSPPLIARPVTPNPGGAP
jgi:transglutaminase-like putative cysteine protease